MHSAALGRMSFVDRSRRPRLPGPSSRVPGTHGGHGIAHFFAAMPWLAWPLVAAAVLVFLALLPLRMFGSAPWYVRLGLLVSAGTGFLLRWRRRKRVASVRF